MVNAMRYRPRVDEYDGKSAEEIKHMWVFGANCGSAFHKSAELFLNNPLRLSNDLDVLRSPMFKTIEFGYFLRFVREQIIGQVEIIRTELRLVDWPLTREDTYVARRIREGAYYPNDIVMQTLLPAVKLAGSADLICRRLSGATLQPIDENSVEIWDWKRSKGIRDMPFGNKKTRGKWPCHEMYDCNRSHYNLQLNLYKWMLENNTSLHVSRMRIVVFHPNFEKYLIYEVPDLQTVIQRLMIQRLRENRAHDVTQPHVSSHGVTRPHVVPRAIDIAEQTRYHAEIDRYFDTAPPDPYNVEDFDRYYEYQQQRQGRTTKRAQERPESPAI
jgi:hypothetical protein